MRKDETYRHILYLTKAGKYDWKPFTHGGMEFAATLEGVDGDTLSPQLQLNSEHLIVLHQNYRLGRMDHEVVKVNPMELREFLHAKFPDVSEVFTRVLSDNFNHLADETKTG